MSAETQAGWTVGQPAGSEKVPTGLVTLVFIDIVGSVALKQQLGDRPAARLIETHHQLVRETLREAGAGKEIETAGDSFLIMFTTPSEAVTFALRLQGRLRELNREQAVPVLDRLGIHLGEVVIREHVEGLKPRDLYGSNVDICARVMSLAKGNQVLMSRGVFDSARQVLKGEDIEGVGQLEWLNHGPYLLKGLDEPVEICEVREAGQEALSPPTSSEKAQRQVRADEEPVLGWRPAVGQVVPGTRWALEKKLGEGGFGEV
jgi:eukaryotic-like serine/threonine-protein kinase